MRRSYKKGKIIIAFACGGNCILACSDERFTGVRSKKSYGDAEGNGIMFDLTGAGTFTVAIDPATNEITVTGDIV